MVQNGNSNNNSSNMPYYLRKYKEATATSTTTATTAPSSATKRKPSSTTTGYSLSIYSSRSSSTSTACSSSTSSSICSSKASTPSPSPSLMNHESGGYSNGNSNNKKPILSSTGKQQQMMVKLCFDEPTPKSNTSLDSTVTASTLTDSINDTTVVELVEVINKAGSKNNNNNKQATSTSVIQTRSKLRRQLAVRETNDMPGGNGPGDSPSAFKSVIKSIKQMGGESAAKPPVSDDDDDDEDDDDDDDDELVHHHHHFHHHHHHHLTSQANSKSSRMNKRPTERLSGSIKVKKKKRSSLLASNKSRSSKSTSNKDDYEEDDEGGEEEEDEEEKNSEWGGNEPKLPAQLAKTGRTPPHKKFRKLRLFDTPHTPKTLIEKSTRLFGAGGTSTTSAAKNNNHPNKASPSHSPVSSNKTTIVSQASETLRLLKRLTTPSPTRSINKHDDVEMHEIPSNMGPTPPAAPITTTTAPQSSLRMRLFSDTNNSSSAAPNKALNFDDTDDEMKKPTCYNTTDCDDEMTSLFHAVSKPPPTPLSSLKCKSVPVSTVMSHHHHQHQQNAMFKPIGRQSNCHQRNGSISSNSSSSSCYHINSPHTPFMSHQIHASVNPFTPTNSFDNSKLSSAANAATMVRLAAANLHQSRKQLDESIDSAKSRAHSTSEEGHGGAVLDTSTCSNNNVKNSSSTSSTTQRLPIRQCLVSRYHEEFHEVCKLGSGEFGDVFKCINRLDGCTYAIKRSKKAIAGSALEVSAWKEVCAHAVLVKHNHIVQYYSAWAEADRMLIQNEYCNGGSLAEFIDSLRQNNTSSGDIELTATTSLPPNGQLNTQTNLMMNELDLKTLLLHIAKGLAYMHSLNLAHLDIKPGNIFICRTPRRPLSQPVVAGSHHHQATSSMVDQANATTSGAAGGSGSTNGQIIINEESGIESEELDDDEEISVAPMSADYRHNNSLFNEIITYKIGDLGHVTSTLDPHVEEGDCRYLPNEILQEQYDYLAKADIFALALTVYVSGSLQELPKNGDEWHWIRQGNLRDLPQCGERFKKLLLQMVSENPSLRPSASTLVHHPCICPDAIKTKAQLRKELNQEKFKNEMLQRKVKKYELEMSKRDSPAIAHLNYHAVHLKASTTTTIVATSTTTTSTNQPQIDLDMKSNKFGRSLSSSNII